MLEIENLTKRFGAFTAVAGLTLSVGKGEVLGLLGPNGAGKTTLINVVCGIVTPTTGVIVANGHDIVRDYRAARWYL